MLVHLRVITPPDLAAPVRALLVDHEHTTNVVVLEGVCIDPPGDVVECDVARETANEILAALRDLGLPEVGGIVISTPTATPFAAAGRLERLAPGEPEDAVIWDAVEEAAERASRPTVTYHAFLVVATVLAAVAVVTDSPVLVVGAMVVGPEFGVVAAACTGILFRRPRLVAQSLQLLIFGFAFAIVSVAGLALLARATGMLTPELVTQPRPQTGFIWHPDRWSVVVALVAGAAGVLALSTEKAQAMVGVFISVTTIPAAGNLALGLAVWDGAEMRGSLTQFGVNVGCMLLAGTLTLALQKLLWNRLFRQSHRLFRWRV